MCSVTKELLAFLKKWEGVRQRVYMDVAGYLTVGVGHLVLPGDQLLLGDKVTDAQVDRFLTQDVQIALEAVGKLVTVPLTPSQCIALVSFTFNLGAKNLERSTLLRVLNEGSYKKAARELLKWNKAGGRVVEGLRKRREAESLLLGEVG